MEWRYFETAPEHNHVYLESFLETQRPTIPAQRLEKWGIWILKGLIKIHVWNSIRRYKLSEAAKKREAKREGEALSDRLVSQRGEMSRRKANLT